MKTLIGTVLVLALLVSLAPAPAMAQDVDWDSVKRNWNSLSPAEQESYKALAGTAQGPRSGSASILGRASGPINRVPGDQCGVATEEISALPFAAAGDNSVLVDDYDVAASNCPTGFDSTVADDVYLVRTDVTCDVTASQDGTFDEVLWVVTDCGNVNGSCIGSSDGGSPEQVSFTATAGQDYFVIVDGWSTGGTGTYTLDITEDTQTGCALIPVELTGFDVE